MKKIVLIMFFLLVPSVVFGLVIIGNYYADAGAGGCPGAYDILTGSDTNAILDSSGGEICCPQ